MKLKIPDDSQGNNKTQTNQPSSLGKCCGQSESSSSYDQIENVHESHL